MMVQMQMMVKETKDTAYHWVTSTVSELATPHNMNFLLRSRKGREWFASQAASHEPRILFPNVKAMAPRIVKIFPGGTRKMDRWQLRWTNFNPKMPHFSNKEMKIEKFLLRGTITYFLNVQTTFLSYFCRLRALYFLIRIKEVSGWKVWEPVLQN